METFFDMAKNHTNDLLNRAFSNLVEESNDFVGVADNNGRVLYLNSAANRLVGLNENADLSQVHIHDFFPDWSVGSFIRDGSLVDPSNISQSRETVLSTKNETRVTVMLSVVAHLTTNYEVDHFVVSARDISDQKRLQSNWETLESRLVDLSRTRTVGKIAVGLAQNLNNSLIRIGRNVGVAMEGSDEESNVRQCLNRAIQSANSARNTVQQMVSAGTPAQGEFDPISIQPIIKDAVMLARASLPVSIVVRRELHTQPVTVSIDPIHIHQIVMNLVINARDAMIHAGGIIEVGLESIEIGEHKNKRGIPRGRCRWARITVTDSGPGMDPDNVAQIFSPHPVDKANLDDASLNLAVVNKIVEDCGGALTIHNKLGQGTSYHVFLPQCDCHVTEDDPAPTGS